MTAMKKTILVLIFSIQFPCFANCREDAEVAVKFMNQYLTYTRASFSKQTDQEVTDWLQTNKLAAPEFLTAHKKKEAEGRKLDPELGWDSDLIFDAQDSPDKGFKLWRCSNTQGFVVLEGVDWTAFKVTVRVKQTSAGRKVIGAGIVNIPLKERARR